MGLKVLSYNILEGGGGRLGSIADIIRQQSPDIVAIQEANHRRHAVSLARDLGMQLVFGEANSKFHVAWLSRLPVTRSRNHRLPGLAKTLLEIEVVWNTSLLRVFATHLAGGADVPHPTDEVAVILEILRSWSDDSHLLVGDLNSLHPDDPVGSPPTGKEQMYEAVAADRRQAIQSVLNAGYVDCYRSVNPESPGYTYPADAPWLRLDYIFASPSMAGRLCSSGTVDGHDARSASDHVPISASFC